jgi:Protein phosphatase 2C
MSAAWRVLGASVRGDSHRRSGAPNQDAIALIPGERGPAIVAVADGHGSAESFRSDTGSAFAVRVATSAVREFFQEIDSASDLGDVERRAKASLVPRIVSGWTEAVNADLAERPITEDDVARLRERGVGADPTADPLVVYGATLVMAAVADSILLLLQIGDGDVVAVSERADGAAAKRPVPKDPRLVGNQTTSLCLPEAVDDFRVRAIDLRAADVPSLLVVSTDGYANSFVNDGAFLQAGPDILSRVKEHGLDWVGEQLPGWLDGASKHGSGDDITMGLLVRSGRYAPGVGVPASSAPTLKIPMATPSGWARRSAVAASIALVVGYVFGRAFDGSGSIELPRPTVTVATSPSAVATSPSGQPSTPSGQWIWAGGTTLIELSDGEATLSHTVDVADLKGRTVTDTAFGFDRIWVTTDNRLLLVVDPTGPKVRSVRLPTPASQIVIGTKGVTLISTDGTSYLLVDPTSHPLKVDQIPLSVPGSAP